jgi:glycosyltransferase involved in cell wall biosynthesis
MLQDVISLEKLPVTAAVPVKNEGANLARCLERLGRFAEVVVIDSGSTDDTIAIAESLGARVVTFKWDGRFPKKRNWFLTNDPPTQPWVLFVDADEFIDDRFCDAVAAALKDSTYSGYWLSYANYFLGRRLEYGLEQRKLALFRVGSGLYERIDEISWSSLDMEIHEHPIIDGRVGEISAPIDHRDYKGLGKFIEKHRDYALWEAQRAQALGQDPSAWNRLTERQRFKYKHLAKWWYPGFYFLYTYVVKRGFLDGGAGFHYAYYKAWYFHTIRLLIRETSIPS